MDSTDMSKLIDVIKRDEPKFVVKFKDESRLHRFLMRVIPVHRTTATLIYPVVWFTNRAQYESTPTGCAKILQHEWVHIKDASTFFGMSSLRLRWLNVLTFYALYMMPQLLGIIAIACACAMWALGCGITSVWCLLGLVFLLPWPSPIRVLAEMRAYRRSRELGSNVVDLAEHFISSTYWFMSWRRPSKLVEALNRPSPYRDEMDFIPK